MEPRFSLYRDVHKGIRALLSDLMVSAGRCDFARPSEVETLSTKVTAGFALLSAHAHHETLFVEPLYATHAPEVGKVLGAAHHDQEEEMEQLLRTLEGVAKSPVLQSAGHQFVVELSRFSGELLTHMADEEAIGMPALQARMTDAELMAVEQRLVGSIPPEKMGAFLGWMLPAMNGSDRAGFLSGLRAGAPAEVFVGVRSLATAVLSREDDADLEAALSAQLVAH